MNVQSSTAHSITVGGSSTERIMACPGSLKLHASMPSETSSFAEEGTALHAAMVYCLNEDMLAGDGTKPLVGMKFGGFAITQDLVDSCIDPALKAFDDLWLTLERQDGEIVDYWLEQKVSFPGIDHAFGTADVVILTPLRVVIVDWKFGAGVAVSVVENKQLMFYAAAVEHSTPKKFWPDPADGKDPEHRVDLVIIQPRVVEGASVWRTTFGDLVNFASDLKVRVDEALFDDNPSLTKGEHCRWCNAIPICPLYKDVSQMRAAVDNKTNSHPTSKEVIAAKMKDMTDKPFTSDDLAQWMYEADICAAWAKAVGALIMLEASEGRPPTGKKLVQKLANTSWVGDQAKVDRMLARFGLDADARRTAWKNISPTQAAKQLKTMDKELRPGITERRPGTIVLVDVADKRTALLSDTDKMAKADAGLKALEAASEPP